MRSAGRLPRVLSAAAAWWVALGSAQAQEQRVATFPSCPLENGDTINDCRVGYRVIGTLAPDRDNVIVLPTWFGGTSEDLLRLVEGGLVDTTRFYAILFDTFGNGVSSSPSGYARDGAPPFPAFSLGDAVRAQHRVLTDVLSLHSVTAVVGLSMGGMQAFQWAYTFPAFAELYVPIVASPRLTSYEVLLWKTELRLIDLAHRCACDDALRAIVGLELLASTTPASVADRIPRDGVQSRVEEFVRTNLRSSSLADRAAQLRAMIAFDLGNGVGLDVVADEFRNAGTRLLVIAAAQDHTVLPGPALAFARDAGGDTLVLDHPCGHLTFACDLGTIARPLDTALVGSNDAKNRSLPEVGGVPRSIRP